MYASSFNLRLVLIVLGHHDPNFSKHKEFYYDATSLKNAKRHLLKTHYLDEHGDTWRIQGIEKRAQPSGVVDGGYEKVIPFRQQEFMNAFVEWVVLDNIKHRKATSRRLLRLFKIANADAAAAIPQSHTTIENWIHNYFEHFEPTIKEELKCAKSRISISFDGWGSKREKISVLGVVVHFINEFSIAVTRLIGLPELEGHAKTGVGMFHQFS